MDEPDWAQVVRVLYQKSPAMPAEGIDSDHPFVTETGLSESTAKQVITSLVDWGVVTKDEKDREGGEYNPDTGEMEGQTITYGYKLTPDGFEVAHERELSSQNNQINYSLMIFTLVLVLAQIVDSLSFVEPVNFVMNMFLLAFLLLLVRNKGLIEI